jgi:hypothetical protein
MPRDRGSCGRTLMRGMNNDPCVYHVGFLLIVGDRDETEGGGRNHRRAGARETRLDCRQPSRHRGKGGRGDGMHGISGIGDGGAGHVWSVTGAGNAITVGGHECRRRYKTDARLWEPSQPERGGEEGTGCREAVPEDESKRPTQYSCGCDEGRDVRMDRSTICRPWL